VWEKENENTRQGSEEVITTFKVLLSAEGLWRKRIE